MPFAYISVESGPSCSTNPNDYIMEYEDTLGTGIIPWTYNDGIFPANPDVKLIVKQNGIELSPFAQYIVDQTNSRIVVGASFIIVGAFYIIRAYYD